MNKELRKDLIIVISLLVVFSIVYLIPFFSMFIYIIWPIPVVYLIMKHGINQVFTVIIIAALLNTLIVGMATNRVFGIYIGMYSIVGFGLIGFFLGSSFKEKFSPLKTIFLTITAVLISNIIIFFIQSYIPQLGYQQLLQDFYNVIERSQMPTEVSLLMEYYINIFKLLFPAYLLIISIIQGLLTYYITIWYFKNKGIHVQEYKPVKDWSFPRWSLSIAVLLFMVIITFLKYEGSTKIPEIYNMLSLNILIVLGFLLFLQGFAVIIYYLSRFKSIALYIIFAFCILFFYYIIVLIGLIDLWFNLRKDNT